MELHDASTTVIMAVKNSGRYLSEALESIAAQTLQPTEIILVDGRSTDNTAEIAGRFPDVRLIQQTGSGFTDAWNAGVTEARGEFIAFLDSDDKWPVDKLARQVGYLHEHPDVEYTLGHVRFFMDPGTASPPGFKPELLADEHVGYVPGCVVARRRLFDVVGGFETGWAIAGDVEWFFRLKDLHVSKAILPAVMLHKRVHDSNLAYASPQARRFGREILAICRASIQRQS